jgi:hypothetical protein
MNIDLLFTQEGEAGLITSENLVKKVAGVLFDTESAILTLEFADMDYMDLNIPVEQGFAHYLDLNNIIHIGAVKNNHIGQAYQVPLMFSDDPYRAEMMDMQANDTPLAQFGYFIKQCIAGQPVFREDLGDEDTMGCILGDASPSALEFAPHLARRYAQEIRPSAAPSINAPGMGLGSGGGGNSGGGTYSGGSRRAEGSNYGRGNTGRPLTGKPLNKRGSQQDDQ